jgi:serpin B
MAENDDVRTVATGSRAFALDLLAALRDAEPGNVFCSPRNLSTALTLAWAGARGRTADQMARVLRLELPPDRVHQAFNELVRSAPAQSGGPPGIQLTEANRLWLQNGFPIREEFAALARERYRAGLATVDFEASPESARAAINAWVDEATHGKISELIGRGVLMPTTRLVLTSAIYFLGTWATPFDPRLTRDGPFHLSATREVVCPLMSRTGSYRYADASGVAMVELPYFESDLAMVVILPAAADGLPALEQRLTPQRLDSLLGALAPRLVSLHLPRFRLATQLDLSDTLKAMGMTDAFDIRAADFSGIDDTNGLFLGAVIHKAFVDVNERGTEAAAATALSFLLRSASAERPVTFRADHPFLFLIRDRRTGSVLFLGRLTDPTA